MAGAEGGPEGRQESGVWHVLEDTSIQGGLMEQMWQIVEREDWGQFGGCYCGRRDGDPEARRDVEGSAGSLLLLLSGGGWKSGDREPGEQPLVGGGLGPGSHECQPISTSTPFPGLPACSDQQIQAPTVSENQEPVDRRDRS